MIAVITGDFDRGVYNKNKVCIYGLSFVCLKAARETKTNTQQKPNKQPFCQLILAAGIHKHADFPIP